MNYSDIRISQKQSHEFALAIYADIEEYIKNHTFEYEAFLAKERLMKGSETDDVDRTGTVA